MRSLRWLDQLQKAIETRYEEVLHDNRIASDTKATMLPSLNTAMSRLANVRMRAGATGITAELKTEIIQAIIEADVGEFLGR